MSDEHYPDRTNNREPDDHTRHEAAQRSRRWWDNSSESVPADFPYLVKKTIGAHGIRFSKAEHPTSKTYAPCLVIPIRDLDGKLHSAEAIFEDGTKRFETGGLLKGNAHVLGGIQENPGTILIAEGYATCASLMEATGIPTVCAFCCWNLASVTLALRARYPEARLLICGDRDDESDGQRKGPWWARESAKLASAIVVLPPAGDYGKDYNDLLAAKGPEAVSDRILQAMENGEDDEETLIRISSMNAIAYDRIRKKEAKRLGITTKTLDGARDKQWDGDDFGGAREVSFELPEPWEHPVDGSILAADVERYFKRFAFLPKGAVEVMTLFAFHCHSFGTHDYSPILHFDSPEPECGKSTAMELVAWLAPKPKKLDSVTPAYMFRVIQLHQPLLLLDEIDNADLELRTEMLAVINGGFHRSGCVGRTVGEDHTPVDFSTFCPKLVGGLAELAAPTASRTIKILMQRKPPGVRTDEHREAVGRAVADPLRRQLARWAIDHLDQLAGVKPPRPSGIGGRRWDVVEPLAAIATLIGWTDRLHDALRKIWATMETESSSMRTSALRDALRVFADKREEKISPADLVKGLNAIGSPWDAYGRKSQPISSRQFGRLVSKFGILARNSHSLRFYLREEFEVAWKTYEPPEAPTDDNEGAEGDLKENMGLEADGGGSTDNGEYSSAPPAHNRPTAPDLENIDDSELFQTAPWGAGGGLEKGGLANTGAAGGGRAVTKGGALETDISPPPPADDHDPLEETL